MRAALKRTISIFLCGAFLASCENAINNNSDSADQPIIASRTIDWSNTIETRVFIGSSTTADHQATANASVQAGWVLVGGGCKIEWGGTSGNGALLTASYPNDDLSTWTCRSKDHLVAQTHTLYSWAIGMRIKNVSESSLRQVVRLRKSPPSGVSSLSTASAAILPGEILLGGGASITSLSNQYGALLTASYPKSDRSAWVAVSKDNYFQCAHSAVAYSITMPKSVFGHNFSSFSNSNSTHGAAFTHTYDASIYVDPNYALTSVGGIAGADDPSTGRYLFAIYPDANYGNYAFASTKDHWYSMSGNTSPYWLGIKKD